MTQITAETLHVLHPSWGNKQVPNTLVNTLEEARNRAVPAKRSKYSVNGVPFYNILSVEELGSDGELVKEIYDQFFGEGGQGALVLRMFLIKRLWKNTMSFVKNTLKVTQSTITTADTQNKVVNMSSTT